MQLINDLKNELRNTKEDIERKIEERKKEIKEIETEQNKVKKKANNIKIHPYMKIREMKIKVSGPKNEKFRKRII